MIKSCTCKNEYMDKRYGQGKRVHTVGAKGDERCCVCGGPPKKVKRVAEHARTHVKAAHG